MRLDSAVIIKGLLRSRTVAKEYVRSGRITVNGATVTKPSFTVVDSDLIELSGEAPRYVSRGGEKLEGALLSFGIDVSDFVCCDIGSSTGGFTDCLLQHGARKVYAVDSGTDQLAGSLADDPRVVSIENFNARELSPATFGELCDAVTVDVSFISQTYIIPAAVSLLKSGGIYIGLIKPQFECGRDRLGKNGIVKDEKFRREAVDKVIGCAEQNGISVGGTVSSPITGGDGNEEFLFYGIKNGFNDQR